MSTRLNDWANVRTEHGNLPPVTLGTRARESISGIRETKWKSDTGESFADEHVAQIHNSIAMGDA